MKICFDTHNNEKQKEVAKLWVDSVSEEIVYGGSKGSGKSYLGCSLIFGDALIYPGTHYYIARATLTDLRKYTIPSIHEVFSNWGIPKDYFTYNGQDNYFQLYNGSRVYLLDAKYMPSDPLFERFGSMQMTRGWIEEGGEFSLECKNNLSASVGRWNNDKYGLIGKLLISCNPSKNFLYSDFYKRHKTNELPKEKKFVQALPEDNKMLDKNYLDRLKRTLTPAQKERLLFGNWEYDDDPAVLMDFDSITDLFTNSFVEGGDKVISADIALQGSDKFVITVWSGLIVEKIISIPKCDAKEAEELIRKTAEKYKVPRSNIVYDSDGIGAFLGGYLKGARAFHNGGRPLEGENYQNLKSQCFFYLAEKVNNKEIYIKDEEFRDQITQELEQIKRKDIDKDGKVSLEQKEKVKDRLGRSPDFADSLAMRMFFLVGGKSEIELI